MYVRDFITYDYERLSEVLYTKNLFNRVTYTYGKPGEKYNRAGRLVLVEDASGGEAYYYGNQGEVVKTVRSVMVSTADVRHLCLRRYLRQLEPRAYHDLSRSGGGSLSLQCGWKNSWPFWQ